MTEHIQANNSDFGAIQVNPDHSPADAGTSPRRPSTRRKKSGPRKGSEAPNRRKKSSAGLWRGASFYLSLLILAILIFSGILLFFLPGHFKKRLSENMSQYLGRPVEIGEFSLSPLKGKLYLGNIALGADPTRPQEPPLGTINSIKAGIQTRSLLKGHWFVQDVEMEGLRVHIQRHADGSYTRLTSSESGFPSPPQWLTVHGFKLRKGRIQFWDQVNGREHHIQDIDFSLAQSKPLQPNLRALLDSSPVFIQGQQHIGSSGPEIRFTLQVEDIELQHYLDWIPSNAVQMQADGSDTAVDKAGKSFFLQGVLDTSGLVFIEQDDSVQEKKEEEISSPVEQAEVSKESLVTVKPEPEPEPVQAVVEEEKKEEIPPPAEQIEVIEPVKITPEPVVKTPVQTEPVIVEEAAEISPPVEQAEVQEDIPVQEPVQEVIEEKKEEEVPPPAEQAEVVEPVRITPEPLVKTPVQAEPVIVEEEEIPSPVEQVEVQEDIPVQAIIQEVIEEKEEAEIPSPVEQVALPEPVQEDIPVQEPVQEVVEKEQEDIPVQAIIQEVIEEKEEAEIPPPVEQVALPEPVQEDIPEDIPDIPVQEVVEEKQEEEIPPPVEQAELPEPVQDVIEEDELDKYFHPTEQAEVPEPVQEDIPEDIPTQEVIEEDELDKYFHPAEQEDSVDLPAFPEISPEPVAAYFPLDKVAANVARLVNANPNQAAVEWDENGKNDIVELHDMVPAANSDFALVLALLTDNTGIARLTLSSAPASVDALTEALSENLQRLRRQAVVAPEKILPLLASLPTRVNFIPGDSIPDFVSNLEGFASLLQQRPKLGLIVRGCYDRELDLGPLLIRLYEAREMEFPDDALLDLAQDRAAYIQHYLVENLGLPAKRLIMQEGSACGHQVDLLPRAAW